jgi:hypothetical protein
MIEINESFYNKGMDGIEHNLRNLFDGRRVLFFD